MFNDSSRDQNARTHVQVHSMAYQLMTVIINAQVWLHGRTTSLPLEPGMTFKVFICGATCVGILSLSRGVSSSAAAGRLYTRLTLPAPALSIVILSRCSTNRQCQDVDSEMKILAKLFRRLRPVAVAELRQECLELRLAR